jgi:mannose-6-phosphate isomerase-like protein (cupin superfamily)
MAAPDLVVSTEDKLALFTQHWSPKVIAEANGWEVKLVKVAGEFVPHEHADVDEIFFVLAGELDIRLAGRPDVRLRAGQLFVVPRGVTHQPVAAASAT